MYILGLLCFSDVRYILKSQSVIANNFQVPSHTFTLGIPKFNPNIEYPI